MKILSSLKVVFSSLLLGYCDAGKIRDLCPFNGLLSNKKAESVADPCLTKTLDTNSKRIERGSFHCPHCNVCICFTCGIELLKKETYPASVPKCGEKLEDSLFRLKFYT